MPAGDCPNNLFLRSLDGPTLDLLRANLNPVRLDAGQVLYEPGDDVSAVYFPESGLLSTVTVFASGQAVDATSRGRDGAVGYVEALGSGRMSARIVVQIAGEALCLPIAAYLRAYDSSPRLRDVVVRRTEMLLAEARQTVGCQSFHSVRQRFARTLLECQDHTGLDELPLTQEFLASMAGAGRPRINQAARELAEEGLISSRRGMVEIHDRQGLQAAACECYGMLRGVWRRVAGRERLTEPGPDTL